MKQVDISSWRRKPRYVFISDEEINMSFALTFGETKEYLEILSVVNEDEKQAWLYVYLERFGLPHWMLHNGSTTEKIRIELLPSDYEGCRGTTV